MRVINFIVLHCSASDLSQHDNIHTVKNWHLDRGWSDIGYHDFISKNGRIWIGRDITKPGAHTYGYNDTSIGVCLSGLKTFTEAQFDSLNLLLKRYCQIFLLEAKDVLGHHELDNKKECPVFSMDEVRSRLNKSLNKGVNYE